MESSVRLLRILHAAMLFSIVMYAVVGELAGPRQPHPMNPGFVLGLAMVSACTVLVVFLVRRTMVLRAAGVLAQQPSDAAALTRWRTGHIVTYALCESIAVYGLVLRMLGQTLGQIAPFYLAPFLLILYFVPRPPASDPLRDNMSSVG
jgi:F0F1-type ATP synthase membrane subunit c/vacuolar-type H+-ATPase subunit K